MKTKLNLLMIVFSMLLGCEQSSDIQSSKIVPFYKSCLQDIESYKGIAKSRYGVDLSIKLFGPENGYPAHPGLIGVVTITNQGSSENLQVIENGLELLCFPKHSMSTDAGELGYRILDETIATNLNMGKLENYIVISDGKAVVHFNNTPKEMKEAILQP